MHNSTKPALIDYLIKQLPSATAFVNKKLQVVYASDKWVADFDLSPNEVIGKTLHELFDGLSESWQKVLKSCLQGKGEEHGIEHFLDSERQERWFQWTNITWFDDKENIIGIIIKTEDVSEQVLDELRLEKLEVLLSDKSDLANIGTWEYDAMNQKLHWCKTTKKIHQVPHDYIPDLIDGFNFYKKGYSRKTISIAFYKAMEIRTPWNKKLKLITAKGNEIWVISEGKPLIKNGKIIGLNGTIMEITDHIRSEIKTMEGENLLRTVVDNLPINIYIKDLESRKVLVNKSECEYLGVEHPDELLGKSDFDLYDKEVAQISRDEDLEVLRSLKPILGRETSNKRKDGNTTTFLTSKLPLIGEDGTVKGLVGVGLDISDLKQKEEELRDLIKTASLQNKKLVNFAHIISHNLRSHAANFAMLLDFFVNERDPSEKNKLTNMLVEASDNLLETLENLNEVVAINANTKLNKKPVGLNKTVGKVTQSLCAFLKTNNAKIINDISEDVQVNVSLAYLESILMNFITNGVRYKEPSRDPILKLSTKVEKGNIVLTISDNGLGIDLNKYGDQLFGMYKTFHRHKDARGVGLHITKNQIEAMNGKVTVQSTVGIGTTFKIYFNGKN